MSILKNARRRLFSLTKTPDTLDEESPAEAPRSEQMGRRFSLKQSSEPGTTTLSPRVERRFSLRPFLSTQEERRPSDVSQQSSTEPLSDEEKRKPSSYLFLLQENPLRVWKEVEASSSDGGDSTTYENEIEKVELDKVYHNADRNVTASCKIASKFSEDHFDEYLYEIGILTVKYPRFDDYMSEIELLRQCNHSNVVKFYDVYYFESKLWIFTEYCPSGSIEELIDDLNKPLTLPQIQYVARETLLGLDYLHDKCQITHRDLKCANLLIGQDLAIKIAHFDVAAKNSLRAESKSDKRYIYVKSPHYTAPEILKCENYMVNNFKSDIWSFGITCIEMAEMLPPESQLHPEAIIDQAKYSNATPTLKDLERWSGDFSDFVIKCLNRSYDSRPTAAELLKHQFIKRNTPNKAELETLINERKVKAYSQLKDKFESIEKSMHKMSTIKKEPETFINSYFEELRNYIDLKAEEAKQKIENDHIKLINNLKLQEEHCLKEFDRPNRTQLSALDKLSTRFHNEYEAWKENFSQEVVSENAIHKTKAHTKSLKKQSDAKLHELESTLFANKVYKFVSKAKETKFGELVVDRYDGSGPPAPPQTASASEKRRDSYASLYGDDEEDDSEKNKSNRPESKFIRIEIKRAIKKRYSIY